jgi:hypothetical protein
VSAPLDVFAAALTAIEAAAERGTARALALHTASAPSTSAARLSLDALAHAEGCSRATVRRLLREGAPVHYVGASPRFDLTEWRAWCAERGRRGTKAAPTKGEKVAGVRLLSRGTR